MFKRFFYFAFFFAVIVSVSLLPVAAETIDGKYRVVEVEAEGENRLDAIENALVEALIAASENLIDSKSELKSEFKNEIHNQEFKQHIIKYSRGSIAKYEVIMTDDTQASEGIYIIRLKVWVESELLRDGLKIATNKSSKVAFSKKDLNPGKDDLNVATLENKDSMIKTNKSNSASGIELLSAMLERYNPEDFINIKIIGKVTPVKDKEIEDLCQILVEISFNNQLYNDAFIPDLKQILDKTSSRKKDITLTKQRDILRNINAKKDAPMSDSSIVLSESGLGKDFSLAVFDKPDRFGCRLYAFSKDDSEKILNNLNGLLSKFKSRLARFKGIEIELLDENGEIISTEEQKVTLTFMLTDSIIRNNIWAFHPTIMKYMGMYNYVPLYVENKAFTIPIRFELPEEYQDITAEINTKLVFEDDFAEAALKTRNALHNAAIHKLTQKINKADFESAYVVEYPLAQDAIDCIEANEILDNQELLFDEIINNLGGLRKKGNNTAFYNTGYRLELEADNYTNQKKCVSYLTQAANINPEAMIRMGEIYEQGFYDVKISSEKANSYYKEGTRILSLLARQGLPSAAVALGHVYIEGLGTRQDIKRAENYYKFAEKAGYIDPEYWMWVHYGVTLRQVTPPAKILEFLKEYRDKDARTCLYLVRENLYCDAFYYSDYPGYRAANIPASFIPIIIQDEHQKFGRFSTCIFFVHDAYMNAQQQYFKFNGESK